MPAPWSAKGAKSTIVGGDEFMILDSQEGNPAIKNKRVTANTVKTFVQLPPLPNGSMYIGDENGVTDIYTTELETKADCRAATTGNITLANLQTIDGVSLAAGNRVLVKNQNTSGEFPGNSANGIYIVVDGGSWTRSTDANTNALVNNGMFTKVTAGTVNIDTAWVLSTPDPITLNTTKLVIDEFDFAHIATLNSDQTITGRKVFTQDVSVVESGSGAAFNATSYSSVSEFHAGSFVGSRARGIETARVAIQLDDLMASFASLGYTGTTFNFGGFIDFTADGPWTNSSNPTKLQFFTTDASSTSQVEQLRIEPDGTTSFRDNSITDIASILLNDSDDSNAYTILGGALAGNFNVTIPAITANDTFALLGVTQTFTGLNTFRDDVNIIKDNSTPASLILTSYDSAGGGAFFDGRRARGTEATPLPVTVSDNLVSLAAFGYDTAGFELGGLFEFNVTATWTTLSHPTSFDIATTAVDSTSATTRFRIAPDGTASFQDNSITNIASILLNDDDDSHAYTILGGALAGNFNVTIPAITANDTFALLGIEQTFTETQTIASTNLPLRIDYASAPIGSGIANFISGLLVFPTTTVFVGEQSGSVLGSFFTNQTISSDTVSTIPVAVTLDIAGEPLAGAMVTLTETLAFRVRSGKSSFGGNVVIATTDTTDLTLIPPTAPTGSGSEFIANLSSPDGTITFTGAQTGDFIGTNLAIPTLTSVTVATIPNASTLRIEGAPVQAGSITITNPTSLHVVAGLSRFDGNVDLNASSLLNLGILDYTDAIATIAAGSITATVTYQSIAGQGGVADDLDTITAGTTGQYLIIRPSSGAVTITVTSVGNISTIGGNDFVMDDNEDTMTLIYDGADWIELSRNIGSSDTPWTVNHDAAGFNLINLGLLNQKIDDTTAVHELEANHTTPANGQIIGQLDFIDDDDGGVRTTYGKIRTLIENPADFGGEDGEMFFSVIKAGTLKDYISINSGNSDSVDINATSLRVSLGQTFGLDGAFNNLTIVGDAGGLTFNVEGGDNFAFSTPSATDFLTIATSLLTASESSDTAADSFEIRLQRQRTTDPEDVLSGDSLGKITAYGADTAVPAFAEGGRLEFQATENWDDTDHGTQFEISTTTNLDDTPTIRLTIEQDGTANFETNTLSNVVDPTNPQDAATKNYVDNVALGLSWKEPVDVASTADIDLAVNADPSPVDGETLADGDRILLKNQDTATENGIYDTVTATNPTTWTRSSDMATASDAEGAATFVIEGTVNGSNAFVQTATPAIVGTNALTFVQFTGLGQITAGAGLTKALNVLNVGAGTGITVNPDNVALTIPVVVSSGGTGAITLDSTAVLTGNGTGIIGSSTDLTFASSLLTGSESSDTPVVSFEERLQRTRVAAVVEADDSLGKHTFFGAEDASSTFVEGGRLEFKATQQWASDTHGTRFEISTVPDTTAGAPVLRFTVEQDGTTSFEDNSITNIASILLNDSDDSNAYTILGGALAGNFNVTIPAITANDTFALLGIEQTFTEDQTFSSFSNTASEGSFFNSVRGRGTISTPLAVLTDDILGGLSPAGQFGTSVGQTFVAASANFVADFDWEAVNVSTRFELSTTDTLATAIRLVIGSDGTASFEANDVTNVGLLNQKIDDATAVHELEANHATPANDQIIGQIDFIDDDDGTARTTYGKIRTLIEDPTSPTEDGQMFLSVIKAGTLKDYISINANNVDSVNVNAANLQLDTSNSIGFDGVTSTQTIIGDAGGLTFTLPASDTFDFVINATSELTISPTAINAPNAAFQENSVPISTIGLHELSFDAADVVPTSTNGATSLADVEIGSGGNQKQVRYIEFADGATQNVTLKVKMPNVFDNGTIQVRLYWYVDAATAGNVRWEVKAVALGNSDLISTAYGTAIPYTDTGLATADDLIVGALSGAITIGNSPVDNDFIYLNISRLGSDGDDTLGDVARLISGKIQFTTDAAVAT